MQRRMKHDVDSTVTHILRLLNILKPLPLRIIKANVLPDVCVVGWEASDQEI